MKAEKFEFMKMSVEERRKKAEKTEGVELEKAGRLANRLKATLENEKAQGADTKISIGEQAQLRRAQLEQAYKEKAKKDRISDRGNSWNRQLA